MKSLGEAIDAGLSAHAPWKTRLRAAASSGKAEISVADASRDDRCEFGQWLQRDAAALSPADKGSDLEKVKKLHADVHRAAGVALGTATRGDRRAYEAAVAIDGPFAKASIALIAAMNGWKGRVAGR